MTPPTDEAKMSNRERALQIYRSFMRHAHELEIYSIESEIERALDEAEKRGFSRGYNECEASKHDLTDCMKSWVQGQKDMRERAAIEASFCDGDCDVSDGHVEVEKRIRALPIEGE